MRSALLFLSGTVVFWCAVPDGIRAAEPESPRREIVVGAEGLTVDEAGARFEGVDFVRTGTEKKDSPPVPALIRLTSASATFQQCTFCCEGATENLPFAIDWTFPGEPDPLRLPTGKVVFRDCIFRGVAGAVRCDPGCTLVFEFDNVLHLSGPLIAARRLPAADAPLVVRLSHCTLRESGSAIRWRSLTTFKDRMPGSVRFEAKACVFALASGTGVFQTVDEDFTAKILGRFTCTGQGSILDPGVPLFVPSLADQDAAVIRGFVRATVGFAGLPGGNPKDNEALQWQAPLKTSEPPGIDPSHLPTGEPRKPAGS